MGRWEDGKMGTENSSGGITSGIAPVELSLSQNGDTRIPSFNEKILGIGGSSFFATAKLDFEPQDTRVICPCVNTYLFFHANGGMNI